MDCFERNFLNFLGELEIAINDGMEWLESKNADPKALYLARFVTEEMATNIIKYGYDDKGQHEIFFKLALDNGTVTILLVDDGHEFNPLEEAPVPKVEGGIDERTPGGLGIWLVQKLSDMSYERKDGKNWVQVSIAPGAGF